MQFTRGPAMGRRLPCDRVRSALAPNGHAPESRRHEIAEGRMLL